MYLRFEDWTTFTSKLDKKGVRHGGKIIKVFATDDDPKKKFGKPTIVVVESSDEPFTDGNVFDFGERGIFTGLDFERAIAEKGVNDKAVRIARALARFSIREDTGFAYVGMQVRVGDDFLLDHPLDGIHGWERTIGGLSGQEETLHLDIITSTSLLRLRRIVDFENPALVMTYRERISYEREVQSARKEQE